MWGGGTGDFEDDEIKNYSQITNQGATHLIHFDFCGSWGFKDKVDDAIVEIDKRISKRFNFTFNEIPGISGELDCTVSSLTTG